MRTADRYPAFCDGWIVIDAIDAPALRNAIGSRIFRSRRAAEGMRDRARSGIRSEDADRIQAVPVDGPNGVFALDYIDADDVIVRPDGQIRMAGTAR